MVMVSDRSFTENRVRSGWREVSDEEDQSGSVAERVERATTKSAIELPRFVDGE